MRALSISLFTLSLLTICLMSSAVQAEAPLFSNNFDSPKTDAATKAGFARKDDEGKPLDFGSVERGLVIRRGQWQTPQVPVQPFRYYRVTCQTRSTESCFISVTFIDAKGEPMVADAYDRIDASEEWQAFELCVRSHADAKGLVARFFAGSKAPLRIDDLRIDQVDAQQVALWADTTVSHAPIVRYRPPTDRHKYLPRTLDRLNQGRKLRVVMLGDSICNDTSNSLFETLLNRDYPGAQIEVVTSVRGSTGCQYYQHENRVKEYVLRYRPDLLMIAGISHNFEVEPIRSVIKQARAASDCEIMVMSGAITPHSFREPHYFRYCGQPRATALRRMEAFPEDLRQMLAEEKVEYLDMRSAWDQYTLRSYRPQEWLMRDAIHANSRGKLVVGRILSRYLQPQDKAGE